MVKVNGDIKRRPRFPSPVKKVMFSHNIHNLHHPVLSTFSEPGAPGCPGD